MTMINSETVRVTKRDLEVVRFINEFGFCEMPQIEKQFSIKRPLSYRLMKRLIAAGLVLNKRVFHFSYGAYILTPEGAKCTDLPPLNGISLGSYDHQRTITDIYIRLKKNFPDTSWISERRLKHEKYYSGVGKSGHLSDGMLVFPDGKQVSIEVELSLKGKERIQRILKHYAATFDIKEVWYFCPQGMMKILQALAEKMPFVKIYDLGAFLYDE